MQLARRSVQLVLVSLGLAVVLGLFFRRPVLRFMGTIPIARDELRPAQLVAVISGALPEIRYGVDLYKQGLGEKILFLGHFPVELTVVSKEPFDVVERPWDEIAGRLAVNAGVPPEHILYSTAITASTYERVNALLQVARNDGRRSVIIVCDLVHSRRVAFSARRIARGSAMEWMVSPTPASYYLAPYRYDPKTWWRSETFVVDVFAEYLKLLYYWGRYGL
jgi:hypothetical protein